MDGKLTTVMGLLVAGLGCSKGAAPNPAFDNRWTALADQGVEALYIEDDQAQGLMGSVRRVKPPAQASAQLALTDTQPSLPEQPQNMEVQRIVRGNMSAVKVCYMSMTRAGVIRSGKAIVSFAISPEGTVVDAKVDAPSFTGTQLPGCVMTQVSRWSFPKSQKGGGAFSYPFVFVGG